MNQMASGGTLALLNEINLGTLEVPASLDIDSTVANTIEITWSNVINGNGTSADQTVVLVAKKTQTDRETPGQVVADVDTTRQSAAVNIGGLISGQVYEVYIYWRGAGTAEGLLSVATPLSVTVL